MVATDPQPAQTGASLRRLPRRIVRIPLPAPYQDFRVEAQVNFSQATRRELLSGEDATRTAFASIITEHDLVDEEGRPYPPAGDPALIDALPTDLAVVIIRGVFAAAGTFPDLAAGARRVFGRG